MQKQRVVQDRFWQRVDQSNGDEACWLWMGATNEGGYGIFSIGTRRDHKYYLTHHLALVFTRRTTIPEGKLIRHLCRNRLCVNPKHLLFGDRFDNMADRKRDGWHD